MKFTERGEVVVRICARALIDGDHVLLRFAVQDTGIGIARRSAGPACSDAFSQADSSTTRRYGGTGLGLAISEQLVERMGGDDRRRERRRAREHVLVHRVRRD